MDVEMESLALVPGGADIDGRASSNQNRPYNEEDERWLGEKNLNLAGLALSYLVAVTSIIVGVAAARGRGAFYIIPTVREIILLGIECLVTITTDSLGSIHGTSLRWALFNEDRLEFNTNLRLFTSSRRGPNSVISNAVFMFCLVTCYAAGSLVLVSNTYDFYLQDGGDWKRQQDMSSMSLVALVSLGVSMLVLCFLSTWSIVKTKVPTWSSNPLTTVSVSMDNSLRHRDGRCMMAVHDRKKSSMPTRPRLRQGSAYAASSKVRTVLIIITAILVGLAVWTAIIGHINSVNNQGKNWSIIAQPVYNVNTNPTDQATNDAFTPTVFLVFFLREDANGGGNPEYVPEIMMLGVLVFRMALQCIVTIGLHCVEVLVGMSRDEQTWRTLASPKGSIDTETYDSMSQFFKSWRMMTLFIFKPVVHWMFGQAVGFDYAQGILMRVPHLAYLTMLWFLLVAFAGFLSFKTIKGTFPASYGHLQVMADVIDQWAPKMFWGDKGTHYSGVDGQDGEVRHAGTSDMLLPEVWQNALYS